MGFVTWARATLDPSINRISSGLGPLLLNAAQIKVEDYIGRPLVRAKFKETVNGGGINMAFLAATPLVDVNKVVITGADRSVTTISGVDLTWSRDTGQVQLKADAKLGSFPEGLQNCAFTYTGGYTFIDDAVQELIIQTAVAIASRTSMSADLALGANDPGDYSSQVREAADKTGLYSVAVKQLLDKYLTPNAGTLEVIEY